MHRFVVLAVSVVLASAPPCLASGEFGWIYAYVRVSGSPGTTFVGRGTAVQACSIAWARCSNLACTQDTYVNSAFGFDQSSDCYADAQANVYVWDGCVDDSVRAMIATNNPTFWPGDNEIYTVLDYNQWGTCYPAPPLITQTLRTEVFYYRFSASGGWEAAVVVEAGQLGGWLARGGRENGHVYRRGTQFLVAGEPVFIGSLSVGNRTVWVNCSAPPPNQSTIGTVVVSGTAGDAEISTMSVEGDDNAYDVNGDGRFNILDRDALEALIGQYEWSWDYNRNDIIDAGDVAILVARIAMGLHSGIPGDMDGDGTFNCTDWAQLSPFPSAILGDAAYRIELDADLDGDTDAQDRDALIVAFGHPDCNANYIPETCEPCSGDMDCDGAVGFFDLDPFVEALGSSNCTNWSNCCPCMRADANGDGVVNFFDIDPFVALLVGP